ncbi:hypothetical protein DPSP01_004267 [Paraphaeosphaeria sporulosa]
MSTKTWMASPVWEWPQKKRSRNDDAAAEAWSLPHSFTQHCCCTERSLGYSAMHMLCHCTSTRGSYSRIFGQVWLDITAVFTGEIQCCLRHKSHGSADLLNNNRSWSQTYVIAESYGRTGVAKRFARRHIR